MEGSNRGQPTMGWAGESLLLSVKKLTHNDVTQGLETGRLLACYMSNGGESPKTGYYIDTSGGLLWTR
jgi:hypothetical protein